jgi:hypothetical protein
LCPPRVAKKRWTAKVMHPYKLDFIGGPYGIRTRVSVARLLFVWDP